MAVIDSVIRERVGMVIGFLSQFGRIRAAYLFGSHANGSASADSDIDIAAFIEGAEDWDLDKRLQVAAETQKKLGDDLELHFFSAKAVDTALPGSFAGFVRRSGVCVAVESNTRPT